MNINEFGQPIGDLVPDWKGATAPDGRTLTGRTVIVEQLDADRHAGSLHEALADAPPGHWTYMPWGPFDATGYREWVEGAQQRRDPLFMAICAPSGRPLGVAGYMNINPTGGSIEVGGITYAPQLQGTVAASEAMFLMMRHAFDDLGFRRYEWKCDALNDPSRRAALRLGFAYEGEFAQHLVVRGRNRDTAWFSITDERWRQTVGPALRVWLDPDNFGSDGAQVRRLAELMHTAQ